jgi:hypothetical protein
MQVRNCMKPGIQNDPLLPCECPLAAEHLPPLPRRPLLRLQQNQPPEKSVAMDSLRIHSPSLYQSLFFSPSFYPATHGTVGHSVCQCRVRHGGILPVLNIERFVRCAESGLNSEVVQDARTIPRLLTFSSRECKRRANYRFGPLSYLRVASATRYR